MSLLTVSQQITIYGGFILAIGGIFGNSMNILIFSTYQTYRTTPSTFCFLINSIINLIYLCMNLLSRILSVGYGIDYTRTSILWCKTRSFSITTFSLISFTCSCLSAIDQYFLTSSNVQIRQYSQMKYTYRILLFMSFIWCLHGIPYFIYLDISSNDKLCMNTNLFYRKYLMSNIFILLCLTPIFIMILFGYLAYRNIRQTIFLSKQQVDRKLTRIIFVQVLLVIASVTPYGIFNVYMMITKDYSKDAYRQMQEYFISTIVGLISYFYFVGNFYMFFIVSSRFREKVKDRIFFWRKSEKWKHLGLGSLMEVNLKQEKDEINSYELIKTAFAMDITSRNQFDDKNSESQV
ncbi:unnamed protein product [Adineta ricciae]|uniref:G-protein coupled receptors family 1 profile domain-containing protein n=1 Tax=Adineta ricciae TaxID=249248 RepID=A0A814TZG6_ADIRI|nr:unnamed protein product [Adineta ricciae]CAF1392087.1 unnamed protein product [Adineta ricciae]